MPDHHGWDATGEELSTLAPAGMFDEQRRPRERYGGILDRLALYGDAAKLPRDQVTAIANALRS